MGIGDSIGKAAENAMEDLAGTSDPAEKMDVPDPANPNDDVEVHSSISEGSNALEAEKQKAPGLKTGAAPNPVSGNPAGGGADGAVASGVDAESAYDDGTPADSATVPPGVAGGAGGKVAGPAGLPEDDPEELRADPSESGGDPSTSTGRG